MNSYTSVCSLWESDHELAADIGATAFAVQKWRQRDKIPPGWWQAIVDAAKRRGIKGVTLEKLADIAKRKRQAA